MERLTLFADVIVPLGVPNLFTYRIPQEMQEEAMPGKRVLVQFGKKRIYTGIIHNIHSTAPKDYTAKYLETILDDHPIVQPAHLKFWDWIAYYYCCNPGDVMNAALPSGLKLSSTSTLYLNNEIDAESLGLSANETRLMEALQQAGSVSLEDAAEITGLKNPQPLVNQLVKKRAVMVQEEVSERYKPLIKPYVRLAEAYKDEALLKETLDTLERKAFRQAEALIGMLGMLQTAEGAVSGWIMKSELVKRADANAVNALVKKAILEEQGFETARLHFEKGGKTLKQLSGPQQAAFEACKSAFSEKKPVLLQGVTGSGKTEVYIALIREALQKQQQVLYLVPEIALTTQLITRLRAVFGETVGVYHSRFSENERVEIWSSLSDAHRHAAASPAERAEFNVILGARSALFLPFRQLGLIIVDEEHDASYKQQDPAPRYHARDAALYLAATHGCDIILGSATPSLESWYNAKQDKYVRVELPVQFVKGSGTDIHVCDIKYYEERNQMRASLTMPLYDAVKKALASRKQVILFQNRRGFAPVTVCSRCGFVPHCIQCDVPMIYHKQRQRLVCHYCGYNVAPLSSCPACGSPGLQFRGMGTEKVEEDVEVLFPEAKIARMDLDSTRSKHAHRQLIDEFESGNVDILIGTQMVTKGLDFSNVDVVGILNADSLLNFPDFRAFERGFQLMTQVRGRAGRAARGHVYVQTTRPDHPVIKHVADSTIENFYGELLEERRHFFYPPFSRLFALTVVSKDPNEVNHLAQELLNLLKPGFGEHILGPEFPPVSKVRNDYHKRLLVKVERKAPAHHPRNIITLAIHELHNTYRNWKFRVIVNVDPV